MEIRDIAFAALDIVGDQGIDSYLAGGMIGEWEEYTGKAFHLRRRLSAEEQESVGPAIDIRGTGEAINRALKILSVYPTLPEEMVKAEVYDLGSLKGELSHIVAHRK